MSTFILYVVLSYSTAQGDMPGGAALTTFKQEFFTMQQCRDAEKEARRALDPAFKRFVTFCLARPEPGEEIFNLEPRGSKKGG